MELLNPKNFFYLNALVVLAVIIFLMRRPKGMNLKWKNGKKGSQPVARDLENTQPGFTMPPSGDKSLNVFFQFNGHSWDAYEVLGIPAGSSWSAVQEAHRVARQNIGPESSEEFLDMALEAIRKHQN